MTNICFDFDVKFGYLHLFYWQRSIKLDGNIRLNTRRTISAAPQETWGLYFTAVLSFSHSDRLFSASQPMRLYDIIQHIHPIQGFIGSVFYSN